jgi:hypothetical protein
MEDWKDGKKGDPPMGKRKIGRMEYWNGGRTDPVCPISNPAPG